MQTNTAANRNGRKDTTPNTVRSTAQTMSGTMKSTNKGDQVKSSLYSRQMLNSNNLELHFNTMHKRKIDHEKTRTIIQENPGLTHIHINRCENFSEDLLRNIFTRCQDLEILTCMRDSIAYIPEEIGTCYTIRHLCLKYNNLFDLPNCLKDTYITWLDVGHNKLTYSCLDTISQMPNLRVLDLANNDLVGRFPNTLDLISDTLCDLQLSHNGITSLWDSISNLTKLVSLDLSGNEIELLPFTLSYLIQEKMIYIDISDNPLQPILKKPLDACERKIKDNKSDMLTYLNVLKGVIESEEYKAYYWQHSEKNNEVEDSQDSEEKGEYGEYAVFDEYSEDSGLAMA